MLFFNHTPPLTHPDRITWNFSKCFGFLGGKNEKILRMVRNAQKMISRMFFIVGYFPHLGGVNEVWKISTQFIFFLKASLISHYFRGPYVGCSWWAPARGCPHFSNFWKSPKNEASRAKKLKFNENKDFWKSCFLGPP